MCNAPASCLISIFSSFPKKDRQKGGIFVSWIQSIEKRNAQEARYPPPLSIRRLYRSELLSWCAIKERFPNRTAERISRSSTKLIRFYAVFLEWNLSIERIG